MILIYSLFFATMLSLVFTKSIKKHCWIYYLMATLVAASTTVYEILKMTADVKLYGFIAYVEKASIKGIIAISVFVLVMFAGALSTKLSITKKLLSIRAELAIIGSILMLPHGCIYLFKFLKYSLPKIINQRPLPLAYLTFIVIGIVAFVIMMPLFITSLKKVRRKMKATRWKSIQRWAYAFYFLAYAHVIIILLNSKQLDWIKLIAYTVIFGSYTILKIEKVIKLKQSKLNYAANH